MSISEIIKDIQITELMQFPPQKKRKFPPVDKSKYYKFYRDYGHNTNNYITSKDEIKMLTKKGQIGEVQVL